MPKPTIPSTKYRVKLPNLHSKKVTSKKKQTLKTSPKSCCPQKLGNVTFKVMAINKPTCILEVIKHCLSSLNKLVLEYNCCTLDKFSVMKILTKE